MLFDTVTLLKPITAKAPPNLQVEFIKVFPVTMAVFN